MRIQRFGKYMYLNSYMNMEIYTQKPNQRECHYKKLYDYTIKFKKSTILLKLAKVYPLSVSERNSLDLWIDEELKKGYIQPSTSFITVLFFFVKKYDGSLHLVMDYRALNGITIKNHYPIPQITDLIESLSHASIFIKIDSKWEYNNVCIKKEDE